MVKSFDASNLWQGKSRAVGLLGAFLLAAFSFLVLNIASASNAHAVCPSSGCNTNVNSGGTKYVPLDPGYRDLRTGGGKPPGGAQNKILVPYAGFAVFPAKSYTNKDRTQNPSPLGTYLDVPLNGKTLLRHNSEDYAKGKVRRGIPAYRCKNRPGKIGNVKDRNGNLTGREAYNMPIALSYVHTVGWNAGWKSVYSSDFAATKCIFGDKPLVTDYVCPIKVSDVRSEGPVGEGTKPNPNLTTKLSLKNKKISDFAVNYNDKAKWKKLTSSQKIELVRKNCGPLSSIIRYTINSNKVAPSQMVGNYNFRGTILRVKCSTIDYPTTTVDYTERKQDGVKVTRKKTFAATKWYGCEETDGAAIVKHFSFYCNLEQGVVPTEGNNYGYKWTNPRPKLAKEFAKKNFSKNNCAPPPRIECVYSGSQTVKVVADGSALRRKAVVAANGKPIKVTWPIPTVRNVDNRRPVPVSDRTMLYSVKNTGAYPEFGSRKGMKDGQQASDPMTSDVSLAGGVQQGWGNPLTWRFFLPAVSNSKGRNGLIKPFTVLGTPQFTYKRTEPELVTGVTKEGKFFIKATGENITVDAVGTCPGKSVSLYVAGSRNVN